jgi:nitrate reductase (cytochrome), electron transfer subunit
MRRDWQRYWKIVGVTGAILAGVFLAGSALTRGTTGPAIAALDQPGPDVLPQEAGMFRMAEMAFSLKESPENGGSRTLKTFQERREFPGAPPIIPHPLIEEGSMGGKGCLSCHADGGYVPPFKAYAPITPHPEMVNCRQCHVTAKEGETHFRPTNWMRMEGPAVRREAMPGAPPPIPHELGMRENCNACHAGPGAVAEIRTTHPERVNCRQCHAVDAGSGLVFQRTEAR